MAKAKEEETKLKIETAKKDKVVKADEVKTTKTTAKAGKRSQKAIEAKEEKLAKLEKKQAETPNDKAKSSESKLKPTPTRTKLERRSKSYKKINTIIDKSKTYEQKEACALVIKSNPVKFDATVELHVRLAVDPRQADQNVRDNVLLPAGTGKKIRVAAYVDDANVNAAKDAGADLIGENDINKELEAGNFSFDVLVATPSQMPKLGKYARLLGPRGLMPNPKSGTVTNDITKAIKEAKAGKVEYRVDSGGIIHLGIGKVSFKPEQLDENLTAVLASIKANKPASIKATYIINAYLTTSMGPSIKLSV